MKKEIKVTNRKSSFVELKDYCVGSMGKDKEKEGHFLEVTEWSNGEGYDIYIHDSEGERQIHLSYGQFDAIKKCVKVIDKTHHKK
jgi:hypothetical protein